MSKRPIKKLVENIVKEFTETSKRVSPRLIYLAKLAKHYDTFEKFENDYQIKNYHGIYWHLTTNPNFQINPKQAPTDMSSLASGPGSTPGLMVTTDIGGWHDTFDRRRQYVAQIDLSDLAPNVDYRYVGRGFGHEIFVFKPEGAKVVKVLPIRQALKQNYDDYRRNLPQNREQLKRIYDLAHGTIQESYIDPSATGDKWKFRVSPLEEKYAVEYIKKRLLPALIKNFNDFRIGKNREYGKYGTRYKGPFDEPITDVTSTIRSLKRINKEYKHMASWMKGYGEFTYEAKAPNGATFEFIIEKSYPHVVRINSLDPWGVGYMGYELKPQGYPGGPIGFDTLIKENIEPLNLCVSKEDEMRALQHMRRSQTYIIDHGKHIYHMKQLKKYKHVVSDDPNKSDTVVYFYCHVFSDATSFNKKQCIYYGIRKDETNGKLMWGQLAIWEKDWPYTGQKFYVDDPLPLKEADEAGGIPKWTEKQKYEMWGTITKQEEDEAFEYIKQTIVPEAVEKWNNWTTSHSEHSISDDEVRRGLRKILRQPVRTSQRSKKDIVAWQYQKPIHRSIGTLRYHFTFFLLKSGGGTLFAGYKDPSGGLFYWVAGTHPPQRYGVTIPLPIEVTKKNLFEGLDTGLPQTVHPIPLQEGVSDPTYSFEKVSKEEEQRGLQLARDWIREKYPSIADKVTKELRRVYEPTNDPKGVITYSNDPLSRHGYFSFRIIKLDGIVGLYDATGKQYSGLPYTGLIANLTEAATPTNVLTKEDEMRALQWIRNFIRERYPQMDKMEDVTKKLRKVPDEKPNAPNAASYATPKVGGSYFFFRIIKMDTGVTIFSNADMSWHQLDSPDPAFLNENIGMEISKEDEHRAIQFIKQKFANEFGPNIGKLLKKYSHTKAESPDESDDIMYDLKVEGKRAAFRITRTTKGLWVCRYDEGEKDFYNQCYNLDTEDLGASIKESAPTGDWQSWEMITKPEKDRLKLVLEDWIAYIHKIYHPHLANTRTYLVQKTINNLDVTDPRFAAKPLAQLSMEDRLSLGDYVDYKDTTGQASRVMDFLLRISRDYIEPPRPPKPDITLKGITRVESPSMKYAGDVTIHGLEDMKPIIGFGYGGYTLSNDFIKEFSKPGAQLWLDMGQDVKVVNMPEVMKRVQDALEKHKQSLTEVRMFDPGEYERAIQSIIQAHRFTKKDEDTIFHHLQNKIVNGERVGKTLKKTHHQVTTQADDYDIITYSARPGGKDIFYKAIKKSKYKASITYYFNDGNGYDRWELPLSEAANISESQSQVILSKEDEDTAVQYLKSLIIRDERVGKTLKKLGELSPDSMNSSRRAVYAAKIRGVDYNFDIFRSPRRGGLIIVSRPDYKQYTVDMGPAKVVHPLTISKSEI